MDGVMPKWALAHVTLLGADWEVPAGGHTVLFQNLRHFMDRHFSVSSKSSPPYDKFLELQPSCPTDGLFVYVIV